MGEAHREIDIDNIWLEDNSYACLGPFNVCLDLEMFKSRLELIAPECILSSETDLDYRKSDIWSLGVVYCCLFLDGFWECLTSIIHSIEDYLIFFDGLLNFTKLRNLTYLP